MILTMLKLAERVAKDNLTIKKCEIAEFLLLFNLEDMEVDWEARTAFVKGWNVLFKFK